MQKILPTVDELIDKYSDDIYTASIEVMEEHVPPFKHKPAKPKPFPAKDAVSKDYIEYARLLEKYEEEVKKWQEGEDVRRAQVNKVHALLFEFAEAQSYLDFVPEQYKAKVKSIAYDKGHSDGAPGYYYWLNTLGDIFKD